MLVFVQSACVSYNNNCQLAAIGWLLYQTCKAGIRISGADVTRQGATGKNRLCSWWSCLLTTLQLHLCVLCPQADNRNMVEELLQQLDNLTQKADELYSVAQNSFEAFREKMFSERIPQQDNPEPVSIDGVVLSVCVHIA